MSGTPYLLFRIYRRVIPAFLRRGRLGEFVETHAPHDFVYNPEYFRDVIENHSGAAAGPMAASIVRDLAPRTVIDVGCGGGNLLEALQARGCEVLGLEYASVGVKACLRRGVPARRFDLRREVFEPEERFDVVCSIEVAEHLPAQTADQYVKLLAGAGDTLVFSAATPGQGGTDHLNEQPHAYWIEKLSMYGLILDETISARWRDEWERAGLQPWFWRNIMVFRKDGGTPSTSHRAAYGALKETVKGPVGDLVHPTATEDWEALAESRRPPRPNLSPPTWLPGSRGRA